MAGGNGKWPSHYKGLNMQLPWDPSNGMVEHLSQENDNPCSHKNLHTKVHCSFAHRAKNCSNGTPCWQVKSLRIPDHGILLSQIKESTIGTLTRSNLQRLVLPEKSQSPKVAHLWFHWSNTLELRKSQQWRADEWLPEVRAGSGTREMFCMLTGKVGMNLHCEKTKRINQTHTQCKQVRACETGKPKHNRYVLSVASVLLDVTIVGNWVKDIQYPLLYFLQLGINT